MGAYNFTEMLNQERKFRFNGIQLKGKTQLLLYAVVFLLTSIGIIFVVNKTAVDPAKVLINILPLYLVIYIGVVIFLETQDIPVLVASKIIHNKSKIEKYVTISYYQEKPMFLVKRRTKGGITCFKHQ